MKRDDVVADVRLSWGWPLGWPILAALGVVIGGLPLLGTWPMHSWAFHEWERTSSEFLLQLSVTAPVAAGFGTYYAGRVTPPSRVFAQRLNNRSGLTVATRHLGMLVATVWVAYAAGLLPAVLRTWSDGAWGALDALSVVTAFVFLAAATALGYLLGALGRSAVLAPVSMAIVFGFCVLGSGEYAVISPVPVIHESLGYAPAKPLQLYRILVWAGLAAWAFGWASSLLAAVKRRPSLATAVTGCLLLAALVAPSLRAPTVRVPQTSAPRECTTHEGVEYCVHAGHQRQLPDLVRGGSLPISAYGQVPERARRVYDDALGGSTYTDDPVVWVVLETGQTRQQTREAAAADVAHTLSGSYECQAKFGSALPDSLSTRQAYVSAWLESGGQALKWDGPFHGKSRAEVQAWFRENDVALARCDEVP